MKPSKAIIAESTPSVQYTKEETEKIDCQLTREGVSILYIPIT